MKKLRLCIAILAGGLLSVATATVFAAAAGEVQQVSGTLSVQRPDGSVRVLALKSEVNVGDVLSTQRESYALIKMVDGTTMTLKPNSQLKIEAYLFVQEQPQQDNAFFRLAKGSVRTITGLVGKRGNEDAYRMGTATGTIGIRGSDGDTQVVGAGEKLDPGTYHYTRLCCFFIESGGVRRDIPPDQVGYSRDLNTAPLIFPKNPGMDLRLPPPTLSPSQPGGGECKVG
jgi:hypothetical protein